MTLILILHPLCAATHTRSHRAAIEDRSRLPLRRIDNFLIFNRGETKLCGLEVLEASPVPKLHDARAQCSAPLPTACQLPRLGPTSEGQGQRHAQGAWG